MQLKIKTSLLQEMTTKAVKGAGNNKLIPLTSMLAIELKDSILTLHTTDMTNHLYVKQSQIEGDDFYVTVGVEQFSKLIGRMTCEFTTLTLKDSSLEVKGNGTYNIELPLDENGQVVKFPNPLEDTIDLPVNKTINLATIKTILSTAKSALATTLEVPCYTGYYIGDKILATDTYKICSIDTNLLGEPALISAEMMDLLDVISSETIDVSIVDDVIQFKTPDVIVYGHKMEGIEDFAVDAITNLVDSEFESKCVIGKETLLQLLDRLNLFVDVYDKNGIYLTFTEEGLEVTSKANNGIEVIPYQSSDNFKEFRCCIDIEMLTSQVKAQASDVVTLYYGSETAIKMTDDNATQIIALMSDEG